MPTDEMKQRIQEMGKLLGNGSVQLPLRIEGWHKSLTDGGWFIKNPSGHILMTVGFVEAERDSGKPALAGNAPARTIVGLLNAVPALVAEVERLERENVSLRNAWKDAEDDARTAATEARWQSSQGEDYGSY